MARIIRFASLLIVAAAFCLMAAPVFAEDAVESTGVDSIVSPVVLPPPASRGPVLPVLYVSFAALNAYDAASTTSALKRGAAEANPMMGSLAARPAAMWAVKATMTAVSIASAERMWRQHRRGAAIATMLASNAVIGAVAAHNAAVIRRLNANH
jgi:hypothetical protein